MHQWQTEVHPEAVLSVPSPGHVPVQHAAAVRRTTLSDTDESFRSGRRSQHFLYPLIDLPFRPFLNLQPKSHILLHGKVREKTVLLKHHADAPVSLAPAPVISFSFQIDFPPSQTPVRIGSEAVWISSAAGRSKKRNQLPCSISSVISRRT